MKKNLGIRLAVVSAFLAGCGMCGVAWAQQEAGDVENNQVTTTPQLTGFANSCDASNVCTGTATLDGFMGSGDVDIYAFWAKPGDKISIDIDKTTGIDSFVSIHSPAPDYRALCWNDDSSDYLSVPDEGSADFLDSYFPSCTLPEGTGVGIYYVAVTGFPYKLADGGVLVGAGGNSTGNYTLILSGFSIQPPPQDTPPPPQDTPPPSADPMHIDIDVRPGQRRMARIEPGSRHSIPVALLSSSTFDAMNVDVSTLTFGRTGEEQSFQRCHRYGIDFNRDGKKDLVCHFDNSRAGFEETTDRGVLKGMTKDGKAFEGDDMLKVIPHKRRGDRHGHNNQRHRHSRWDR